MDRPRLLKAKEVADILRVHRRTLARSVKAGRVPPPIVVGRHSHRWPADVIEALQATVSTPAN